MKIIKTFITLLILALLLSGAPTTKLHRFFALPPVVGQTSQSQVLPGRILRSLENMRLGQFLKGFLALGPKASHLLPSL